MEEAAPGWPEAGRKAGVQQLESGISSALEVGDVNIE